MRLSMKALRDFVQLDIPVEEFCREMTMSGSKVEKILPFGEEITGVVIGKILKIGKHPDADKLQVCEVSIGEDVLQIITGAQNISVGDFVPVACGGAVVFGGKKIKNSKLRGLPSAGMLCSTAELGLEKHDFPAADPDGIFILSAKDNDLGRDVMEFLDLRDVSVEFEITPNRPDCLSVVGLAREAAAIFNAEFRMPEISLKCAGNPTVEPFLVKIAKKDLCPFYSARLITDVKIGPSPLWMRNRLRVMGIEPINNIVDIASYVMLELGQPLHAFDAGTIESLVIFVRNANQGEKITTLDGIERTLSPQDLLIADKSQPLAIAGVMGAQNSAISDATTTVLLESANFSGTSIRRTAKAHNLRTDASSRYEKGLPSRLCIMALDRACQLIEICGAGKIVDKTYTAGVCNTIPGKIELDADFVNGLLGTNFSREYMVGILERLGCETHENRVCVPWFRDDLQQKCDLAEEIARLHGYNNISPAPLCSQHAAGKTDFQRFLEKISETMCALGLSEAVTLPFTNFRQCEKLGIQPSDTTFVKILNPLGEDTSLMKNHPLPAILECLAGNLGNKVPHAALFELATIYIPATPLPTEALKLCAAMYGPQHDFFDAKGIAATLCEKFFVPCKFEATTGVSYTHPGRCACVSAGKLNLGIVTELHPEALENFGFSGPVFCIELDVQALFDSAEPPKRFIHIPKVPAVERDLALLCPENLSAAELIAAISANAGPFLECTKIFDVYVGEKIPQNQKSVAVRLRFQPTKETLTEKKISAFVTKILETLQGLQVTLRQ